jgi:hypothetical protein
MFSQLLVQYTALFGGLKLLHFFGITLPGLHIVGGVLSPRLNDEGNSARSAKRSTKS